MNVKTVTKEDIKTRDFFRLDDILESLKTLNPGDSLNLIIYQNENSSFADSNIEKNFTDNSKRYVRNLRESFRQKGILGYTVNVFFNKFSGGAHWDSRHLRYYYPFLNLGLNFYKHKRRIN